MVKWIKQNPLPRVGLHIYERKWILHIHQLEKRADNSFTGRRVGTKKNRARTPQKKAEPMIIKISKTPIQRPIQRHAAVPADWSAFGGRAQGGRPNQSIARQWIIRRHTHTLLTATLDVISSCRKLSRPAPFSRTWPSTRLAVSCLGTPPDDGFSSVESASQERTLLRGRNSLKNWEMIFFNLMNENNYVMLYKNKY